MKKISRRNFLKVTAAGAVGAAALSLTGCGGSKDNGTTAGSCLWCREQGLQFGGC